MASSDSKSSFGCCLLKIVGVLMALGFVIACIIGVGIYRAASWATTVKESTPATYAPLVVSPGEKEDVDRMIQRFTMASEKKDTSLIDETITATVLNAIIDRVNEGEKAKGGRTNLEAFRGGFDGEHFKVATTFKSDDKDNPGSPQKYVNLEATFDLEIVDGAVTKLSAQKLVIGGKEAPLLVRTAAWVVVESIREAINNKDQPNSKDFDGIKALKLLKREGDRIHIIIDPAKFDGGKNPPPALTDSKPKDAEKTDF